MKLYLNDMYIILPVHMYMNLLHNKEFYLKLYMVKCKNLIFLYMIYNNSYENQFNTLTTTSLNNTYISDYIDL